MNCVAKRVPVAGAQVFHTQATFEPHRRSQTTGPTCGPYSYSRGAIAANDHAADLEDEPKRLQHQRLLSSPVDTSSSSSSSSSRGSLSEQGPDLGRDLSDAPEQLDKRAADCHAGQAGQRETGPRNCDSAGARRRDSLESTRSRLSTSSGNEQQANCSPAHHEHRLGPLPACRRSAGGGTVLVASRYVRPPTIDHDDQLISVTSWQTIPLNDDGQPSPGRAGGASAKRAHEGHPAGPATPSQFGSDEWRAPAEDGLGAGGQLPAKGLAGEWRASDQAGGSHKSQPAEPAAAAKPVAGQQIGKRKAPFLFAGVLASILGSMFFSMGMLCIKLLPDGHGLAEKNKIVCFRGCVIMLLCGSTIIYRKSTFMVRRDELWVNALRSVFGFAGVYGAYVSLKYISMGDSTALVFSSPIWTSLLSHFILNEPLQWIQLLALPASLVGIVLIAHPALLVDMEQATGATERQPVLDVAELAETADLLPLLNETASAGGLLTNLTLTLNKDLDSSMNNHEQFDLEHRWKGIAISLATSFIVSFVYIVLKFRKSTPIQTTTFWLGATTVLLSLLVMSYTGPGEWPHGLEWALLCINGLCSWLGQSLLQWALTYEDASVLSVIRTLDVAMTFSLSALFLEEEILWTSVLGAAIIAAVVVSIMLNSWLAQRCRPPPAASNGRPDEGPDEGLPAGRALQLDASQLDKREKTPVAGEVTLKLEAPSIRRTSRSEAAA